MKQEIQQESKEVKVYCIVLEIEIAQAQVQAQEGRSLTCAKIVISGSGRSETEVR
jgi:hypothetical protein